MALTKIGKEGITGISNSSDANAITISSDEQVTIAGATTLVGSVTHGTDSGDTRFSVNSANQYTMVFKNAGNIAGQIGGGGSDILRFSNAAGATTMEMNAGQQTLPLQPAFLVTPSSEQSNLSINAFTQIAFGTEVFDIGSNFASNIFTAPVTGKYALQLSLRVDNLDIDTTYYDFRIVTSNRDYKFFQGMAQFDADGYSHAITISCVADMDASDTAQVKVDIPNAGASQADVNANSFFSGMLIG